jgi:hypothetical protein
MIENAHPEPEDWSGEVTPLDAASYIYQLSREMAGIAERHGLIKVAAALELARGLAAESLAVITLQSSSGKAAPEDAA